MLLEFLLLTLPPVLWFGWFVAAQFPRGGSSGLRSAPCDDFDLALALVKAGPIEPIKSKLDGVLYWPSEFTEGLTEV